MTTETFTFALSRALRALNLSPQLYNVLTSIAWQQRKREFATTPAISIQLGITMNAVHIHYYKSPQLFLIEKKPERLGGSLNQITLAQEGIELLAAVKHKVEAYAAEEPEL